MSIIMATLVASSFCPSELSNISALAASDEGQLAVVMNDGVLILVSCKSYIFNYRSLPLSAA